MKNSISCKIDHKNLNKMVEKTGLGENISNRKIGPVYLFEVAKWKHQKTKSTYRKFELVFLEIVFLTIKDLFSLVRVYILLFTAQGAKYDFAR